MLMKKSNTFAVVRALAALMIASPTPTLAHDWFVRAGAANGDGTIEKPFADPWMALNKAEANDKIHVAAGTYFGKLEQGNWVIEFPGVQLLGGYDPAFKERNPWKHVTELTWRRGAANRPDISLARVSTTPTRPTPGATIDGFLIDMQGYYDYLPAPDLSIDANSLVRNGAVTLAPGGVLRNSVILNAVDAVRAAPGAIVENNIIVNSVRVAVSSRGANDKDAPVTIRNNTIAFVWDPRVPGKGGSAGIGIESTNNAIIENNLLVHADNIGVSTPFPARATFINNAFYRNLFSNVTFMLDGKNASLDDTDVAQADDAGFKKSGGNVAVDPKLRFDAQWYDRFLKRTTGLGARFTEGQWAETRANAGLLPATDKVQILAPAYPPTDVANLLSPGNKTITQGARQIELPVTLSTSAKEASSKKYSAVKLDAFVANPANYQDTAVEITGGPAGVANIEGVTQVSSQTHKGVWLVDAKGNNRTLAVFAKGTNTERVIDSTPTYASGTPAAMFVVRGTAVMHRGYPKHAVIIDSLETFDQSTVMTQRPTGRVWFVRAGETGGDGSKEKPFKDPYQALEVAQSGDRIQVAQGEYVGKLKSGRWVVDKPYLALYGGWDRDFKARDPWKTPSLLYWPSDSKTDPSGYIMEGAKDHTGLILDGFVFDRKTLNNYDKDGFVKPYVNDAEHLSVYSPETVVRNNTFVNGSGGAVRMSNGVTFENNIIANVWKYGVKVTGGQGTRVAIIRGNTIMFVFDGKAHDASRSSGTGIDISGDMSAILDGNAIQYVDNFAVRVSARTSEVVMTNNSFFRNGTAFRASQGQPPPTIDEKSMHLLNDLAFKRLEKNVVKDGAFPIDMKYYASWFARTSAITTRFSVDDWQSIAPKTSGDESVRPGVGMALDWKQVALWHPQDSDVKGARPIALDAQPK